MSLFSELRRRNVLNTALLYAVASLFIAWAVDRAVSGGIAPVWANEFVLLLLAITAPVALAFGFGGAAAAERRRPQQQLVHVPFADELVPS